MLYYSLPFAVLFTVNHANSLDFRCACPLFLRRSLCQVLPDLKKILRKSPRKASLYTSQVGLLHCLLFFQLSSSLLAYQRHKLLPHLARRSGGMSKFNHRRPKPSWGNPGNENFLPTSIWETLQPAVLPYVHPAGGKLLRVHSPPLLIDFPDFIFVPHQPVADWNHGPPLPWHQRPIPHHCQRVQSKVRDYLGLQKLFQSAPQNHLCFGHGQLDSGQAHCFPCLLRLCQRCGSPHGGGWPDRSAAGCADAALQVDGVHAGGAAGAAGVLDLLYREGVRWSQRFSQNSCQHLRMSVEIIFISITIIMECWSKKYTIIIILWKFRPN